MKALFDGCTLQREAESRIWFFVLLEASGDDLESVTPPVRTLKSEVEDEQDLLNSISLDYGDARQHRVAVVDPSDHDWVN